MASQRAVAGVASIVVVLGSSAAAGVSWAGTAAAQGQQHCPAGAHTLAPPGSHL